MKNKVCVVTSTRADYGLLHRVMAGLRADDAFELQIIVTGMHLSPEFGLTYREIENDGFIIDKKVEVLLSSDTPVGISKSMGLALIGFGDALNDLKPDLVLLLGDRFEIFSVAAASVVAGVPIAHISGGELTEGAFDEAFRHSITKMAQLHFVAAQEYLDRVVQLGEQPESVFLVGGMAIDNIVDMELLDRKGLEKELGIEFAEKNLLVTFHPVTLEKEASANHLRELLEALSELKSTQLIFTLPNADTGSREIFEMLDDFISRNSNAVAYTSLGYFKYLSCVKHVDAVVGNSSSGLSEVPSFQKGTVNIGDRQRGRLKASSVIDCTPDKHSILAAVEKVYSSDFREKLQTVKNPYGEGGAARKIINILKASSISSFSKKRFYDIES